ncbi:hypothetical protein VTL71DRAFT_1435 [Oculimacula yallundae]|uniref:Uncharacterized protein n=1 Tax=Oculimacula yallundae TaxID=86028 RepID=A0ABR4CC23_9HELO
MPASYPPTDTLIDLDLDDMVGRARWASTLPEINTLPIAKAQDLIYANDVELALDLERRCKPSEELPQSQDSDESQSSPNPQRSKIGLVCEGSHDIPKAHQILVKIKDPNTGYFRRSMLSLALARSDTSVIPGRWKNANQAYAWLEQFRDEQRGLNYKLREWIGMTLSDIADLHDGLIEEEKAERQLNGLELGSLKSIRDSISDSWTSSDLAISQGEPEEVLVSEPVSKPISKPLSEPIPKPISELVSEPGSNSTEGSSWPDVPEGGIFPLSPHLETPDPVNSPTFPKLVGMNTGKSGFGNIF